MSPWGQGEEQRVLTGPQGPGNYWGGEGDPGEMQRLGMVVQLTSAQNGGIKESCSLYSGVCQLGSRHPGSREHIFQKSEAASSDLFLCPSTRQMNPGAAELGVVSEVPLSPQHTQDK